MWLALVLALAKPYADAGLSGSDLATFCSTSNPTLGVMCNVYLSGFLDGHAVGAGDRPAYCIPAKVQLGTVSVQMRTWLRAHPETGPEPAIDVVSQALKELYPCGKRL